MSRLPCHFREAPTSASSRTRPGILTKTAYHRPQCDILRATVPHVARRALLLDMANFWNMPKPLREKIYRLHLVQEHPVTFAHFRDACGGFAEDPPWPRRHTRTMPRLLKLCKRTEREAAPIYFGDNTFLVNDTSLIWQWKERLWPRHMKLVRQLNLDNWDDPHMYGSGHSHRLKELGPLKDLDRLTVKVDELTSLKKFSKAIQQSNGTAASDAVFSCSCKRCTFLASWA